jgi:hypothetical protein
MEISRETKAAVRPALWGAVASGAVDELPPLPGGYSGGRIRFTNMRHDTPNSRR